MSTCISTTRFSSLISGSMYGFFGSSQGLRQGDPLSSFLFMNVMEALNRMLSRAMVGGYLSGFSADIENAAPLEISHLFADDMLIMHDANRDQIYNFGHILLVWEARRLFLLRRVQSRYRVRFRALVWVCLKVSRRQRQRLCRMLDPCRSRRRSCLLGCVWLVLLLGV